MVLLNLSFLNSQAPKRYAPADVVSVSIAQRLANQAKAGANERQLQYGSVKEPINGYKIKSIRDVPEENLYKSNGNVLELKNYIFKNQEESSESESSEEEKPQKSKSSAFNPATLEFEDIGYNIAENPKNQYVVVTNNQPQHSHSFSCNKSKKKQNRHFGKKSSCGCSSDLLVKHGATSEQSSQDNSSQEHYFST